MRKQVKNAFAEDRDIGTDAPTQPPAASTRALPPVPDLPPPPPGPAGTAPGPTAIVAAAAQAPDTDPEATSGDDPGEKTPTSGRPRATGGRPPKDTAATTPRTKMTRIPARVPAALYEEAMPLVKGIGRPSWGQLVAWTCVDHRDDVLDHVRGQIVGRGRRAPRGQNREGTAGLQVTASVDAAELTAIDTIVKSAQAKTTDAKITRTMVVIGALDVAVRERSANTADDSNATD